MNELAPVASEIVDKMESAIQALSVTLGVASGHLWAILVKQAYINAITSGIILLIVAGIMIGWYVFARFWYNKMIDDWSDDGMIPLWIVSIAVCLFGLIIIGGSTCDLVGYLINPEYYALNKILAQIK